MFPKRDSLEQKVISMFTHKLFLAMAMVFGAMACFAAPAVAQPSAVRIMVSASCDQGDPKFEILNEGEPWPSMMKVSLIRMDTQAIITERELRMRTGQRIVYRAKDAPKEIEVGIKVESLSFKRPPGYDSIIACAAAPSAPR